MKYLLRKNIVNQESKGSKTIKNFEYEVTSKPEEDQTVFKLKLMDILESNSPH